jgi:hypothetical protein
MDALLSWQGLIGAVVGACLAIIGGLLNNKASLKQLKIQLDHEEKMHRQRLAKERLEELYILITKWTAGVVNYHMHLEILIRTKADLEGYMSHNPAVERALYAPELMDRIDMIVRVQGDSVSDKFDVCMRLIVQNTIQLRDDYARAYATTHSYEGLLERQAALQQSYLTASTSLKKDIIKVIKSS